MGKMDSINTVTIKNLFVIKHLVLIALIYFYTPPSKSISLEELQNLAFSLAVINNEGHSANGFFITENLLVTSYQVTKSDPLNRHYPSDNITNRLMIEEATPKNTIFEIITLIGIDIGEVLITDSENDLAIIKTAESHYIPLIVGSERDINRRSAVFAMLNQSEFVDNSIVGIDVTGFPGTIGPQIGNKLFHTTMALLPKTSGAPVFSNNAQVIGVTSGQPIRIRSNSYHEYDQHGEYRSYTFAVSINRLRNLIERHKDLLERESAFDLSYIYSESSVNDNLDMYIRTPEDQFRLSLVYRYGIGGVPRDDKKTFELLEKASREGHTEAQYQRAKMHYFGIGTENNPQKAFYWANKAANQGYIKAKMLLGHMHAYGIGTPKDSKIGHEWIQKAVDQEDRLFGCDY